MPAKVFAVDSVQQVWRPYGIFTGTDPGGEEPGPGDDDTITAGSAPLGTTNYAVPGGAMYVAKTGNNTNPGTAGSPKLTVAAAITAVASGGTIVIREGVYQESLSTPSGKHVILQAYPGEVVWFDGSVTYTGWSGSGPWTHSLNTSWSPISTTNFPLQVPTAYGNLPEQVWINGVAQQQIADGATPAAGQFSVHRGNGTITIGTNPAGAEVRVSDRQTFLIAAGRSDLYGIGVRRYSPGAVEGIAGMAYYGGTAHNSIIENCVFRESGISALWATRQNMILRDITIEDCGHSGLMITTAHNFTMERFVIRRCNRGGWRFQPTTGGLKITRTDIAFFRDGIIEDVPLCAGWWADVSVTRFKVINVTVDGASGIAGWGGMQFGIHPELADGGFQEGAQHWSYIANCRAKNSGHNIKLLDVGWTRIMNNEAQDYATVGINIQQDNRYNHGNPDAGMTFEQCPWISRNNEVLNNVFRRDATGGIQMIAYQDPPAAIPGGMLLGWNMINRLGGNWFLPAPPGSMVQLGQINPATGTIDGTRQGFNSQAALTASTSRVGGPPGTKLLPNHQGTTAPDDSIAIPLPADVAAAIGVPTGTQKVGPIRPAPVVTW